MKNIRQNGQSGKKAKVYESFMWIGAVLLGLLAVWAIVGIVLYLIGNASGDWKRLFFLWDRPGLSLIILLLVAITYGAYRNAFWLKLFLFLPGFIVQILRVNKDDNSRSKTNNTKAKIVGLLILSLVAFYILLITTGRWFSEWTGYIFKSDWALIFVASIPLLVSMLYLLIERATSFKAKIGGLELEFEKAIPSNFIETTELERDLVKRYLTKGGRPELDILVKDIKERNLRPRVLVIPLDRDGERIDFLVMKKYVYQLSSVAPVEFIVFVDEENQYLGFTSVDRFKANFPKLGIELLFEDVQDKDYFRQINSLFSPDVHPERFPDIISNLIYAQWDRAQHETRIRIADLQRLGASDLKVHLQSSIERVYWTMVENDLSGIPVIDDRQKFIGVAIQEKIAQAVILKLLEKSHKAEDKR